MEREIIVVWAVALILFVAAAMPQAERRTPRGVAAILAFAVALLATICLAVWKGAP